MHIIEQMGGSLDDCIPQIPLRPVTNEEERQEHYSGDFFLWNKASGQSEWEMVGQKTHKRLVISADEGSPLYAAYRFLLNHNTAINVVRDNLYLARSTRIRRDMPETVEV